MEPNKRKVITEMLAISGFTALDSDIWVISFSNSEDCYIQNTNNIWEVYYKNNQINHTDDEMIAGLTILVEESA